MIPTHVVVAAFMMITARALSAQASTVSSADLGPRIDALFLPVITPGSAGCAVGISRDGETVFTRGYGLASVEGNEPITPQTAFNIGSVGKQFTALAVLLLEQRGRLSLDDDVRRYVPELPDFGTPIRVRDLLYHTSGLRDYGTLEILGAKAVHTTTEFLTLMSRQRGLNFATGPRRAYAMAMPKPQTEWTLEMVHALPDDGNRYELVDGELLVSPPPSLLHQRVLAALFEVLRPYARDRRARGSLRASRNHVYRAARSAT